MKITKTRLRQIIKEELFKEMSRMPPKATTAGPDPAAMQRIVFDVISKNPSGLDLDDISTHLKDDVGQYGFVIDAEDIFEALDALEASGKIRTKETRHFDDFGEPILTYHVNRRRKR